MSSTVLDRATKAAVSQEAPTSNRDAVDVVVHIYREFLTDLRAIVRGVSRPLVKTDEDCEGADFAFCIEVRPSDYERVTHETSILEARFYETYGVNFVVIPEVM